MKRTTILASAILAVGAFGFTRGTAPPLSVASAPRTTAAEPSRAAPPPAPPLTRNPFEYESAPHGSPAKPRTTAPLALVAEASPPPAARLVGFVRQAGTLRAALALHGEMTLLAVGESAEGFTLLAADEESGVRLRGPHGEIDLATEP